jgi:hypothetical protein
VGTCVFSNFTTAEMIAFSSNLVALIKSLDPRRSIASGYSLPRAAATHLKRRPDFALGTPDWTADTPDEFKEYLLSVHQPFDIISIHVYPTPEGNRFGQPDGRQYELIAHSAAVAKAAGKPLFVGEFGDSGPTPFMINALEQLVINRVHYAAIWIWEFYQFSTYETRNSEASRYSIEPGYSDDLIPLLVKTQHALATGAGTNAPKVADGADKAPRVVLTWPLPCASVDHPTVFAAVASFGAKSVKEVKFTVDGESLATVLKPPYVIHFDPFGRGARLTEIEAHAVSNEGASATFRSVIRLNGADVSCAIPDN